MRVRSLFPLAALLLARAASGADPTPEQPQFFENKIRPILSEKCYKCHSVELNRKSKGGLTLDTKAGLLKGGETGAAVKPGDPEASPLIKAVLYTDNDLQMPPKGEKAHRRADRRSHLVGQDGRARSARKGARAASSPA